MRKFVKDLDYAHILDMFDSGIPANKIAKEFKISAPAIVRLLKNNNRDVTCSAHKYDNLRKIPLSDIQKQFLVGHILGDGCVYREGTGLYRVNFGHKKDHSEYFHYKLSIMAPFVMSYRESIDKRGNSIMMNASSICHPDFQYFGESFYDENRVKIIPQNLEQYFSALSLAVLIQDDGNLNAGVNMRICTQQFGLQCQIRLQNYLLNLFDLKSKIMPHKYRGKDYYHITLDKLNTLKLSEIIREQVILNYKVMLDC